MSTAESGVIGNRVAGKVALVTGGGRGMGPVHGRVLAQQGAAVVLAGRNEAQCRAKAEALRAEGLAAHAVRLDVARAEDWLAAIRFAEETCGKLDVLVNNAGVLAGANVLDCSLEEWNSIIGVNQTGTFLGMKHAAPAMRRAGRGSIVNISSVFGSLGSETAFAYHASKGAVHQMTRAAATMLAPDIRVNSVTPGITNTDMVAAMGPLLKARVAAYPMGRAGEPIEVAQAVLFLASDELSFVTGSDIRVEGGALAGIKNRKVE